MSKLLAKTTAIALMQAGFLYAAQSNHFYAGADLGVFQANIDNRYIDLSDVIPQNISQPVLQNGFTGGLILGYFSDLNSSFSLGAELNANKDGGSALFQSGAQSAAFTDSFRIKNHLDLDLVPGLALTTSVRTYLKLGLSWAHLSDNLTSPVGYNPVYQSYSTRKTITGFAAGLGIKQAVNDRISVFAEYSYHDYGTNGLAAFQNFTADYNHSVHVYTNSVNVGAMYHFSC